jgi:hypothetical protein
MRQDRRNATLRHCAGALLLAAAPAASAQTPPCTPGATPWLELVVDAGALAHGADGRSIVRVHADGCTELRRAPYLRNAGDFRVQLSPGDMAQLRRHVAAKALQAFDAVKLRGELADAKAGPATAPPGAQWQVLDADRYQLTWHDGAKRRGDSWLGLHAQAQTHPDVAALQALSALALALQDVAARDDAARVAGATP